MGVDGFEPKFNKDQLQVILQGRLERINEALINRFIRIGENFVNRARANRTYKDRTGNLRSSIGYVILKDGVQLTDNFKTFVGPDAVKDLKEKVGISGLEAAQNAIEARASSAFLQNGVVLICVAGMDYAAAVESKGFDVITGTSLQAEEEVKSAIATLTKKISEQ